MISKLAWLLGFVKLGVTPGGGSSAGINSARLGSFNAAVRICRLIILWLIEICRSEKYNGISNNNKLYICINIVE